MEIDGIVVSCPYWMNKLKMGKVILRGFLNGKGSAPAIREELLIRLKNNTAILSSRLTPEYLRKFARRQRIGIDCSGFVYRVLDQLIHLNYHGSHISSLDKIFTGGIDRTSARTLTSRNFCNKLDNTFDLRLGDMIRLMGGKHIAVIIETIREKIVYAHCSFLSTKIQGVHTSIIRILDITKPPERQLWEEKTRKDENFGKKYFHPDKGDGVYRLKVFS